MLTGSPATSTGAPPASEACSGPDRCCGLASVCTRDNITRTTSALDIHRFDKRKGPRTWSTSAAKRKILGRPTRPSCGCTGGPVGTHQAREVSSGHCAVEFARLGDGELLTWMTARAPRWDWVMDWVMRLTTVWRVPKTSANTAHTQAERRHAHTHTHMTCQSRVSATTHTSALRDARSIRIFACACCRMLGRSVQERSD